MGRRITFPLKPQCGRIWLCSCYHYSKPELVSGRGHSGSGRCMLRGGIRCEGGSCREVVLCRRGAAAPGLGPCALD